VNKLFLLLMMADDSVWKSFDLLMQHYARSRAAIHLHLAARCAEELQYRGYHVAAPSDPSFHS
jgi:hypothetical protein